MKNYGLGFSLVAYLPTTYAFDLHANALLREQARLNTYLTKKMPDGVNRCCFITCVVGPFACYSISSRQGVFSVADDNDFVNGQYIMYYLSILYIV